MPPLLPVEASFGALVYSATYQAVGRVAEPVVIRKSSSNFSALFESADIINFLSGYAETLNQTSPFDPPVGLEVETVIFAARAVSAALAADDALEAAAVAELAAAAA